MKLNPVERLIYCGEIRTFSINHVHHISKKYVKNICNKRRDSITWISASSQIFNRRKLSELLCFTESENILFFGKNNTKRQNKNIRSLLVSKKKKRSASFVFQ